MVLKVTKVLAYGLYVRFMYVSSPFYEGYIRISDALYWKLRDNGVPTAQSFRKNIK